MYRIYLQINMCIKNMNILINYIFKIYKGIMGGALYFLEITEIYIN